MPRDFANIQVSIWGNPDVRALPPLQQWLYLQLWTHPDLNYAGVLDWRPGRTVAPLSAGSTAESINALLPLLIERRFVVLDRETEELFLRSYFRHDGLLKQRTLPVSMVNAYSATGSNVIRGAIIHELRKLKMEFPDWQAWKLPQVLSILKHPAIDPAVYPAAEGRVEGGLEGKADPGLSPHPTDTATSTDTASLLTIVGEAKMKETRLPADWVPTKAHYKRAQENRIDIVAQAEAFRLHAETHDRHAANWNAAFTTWLTKAKPSGVRKIAPRDEWMLR